MLYIDLSNIEARMLAWLAKEDDLVQALLQVKMCTATSLAKYMVKKLLKKTN